MKGIFRTKNDAPASRTKSTNNRVIIVDAGINKLSISAGERASLIEVSIEKSSIIK